MYTRTCIFLRFCEWNESDWNGMLNLAEKSSFNNLYNILSWFEFVVYFNCFSNNSKMMFAANLYNYKSVFFSLFFMIDIYILCYNIIVE